MNDGDMEARSPRRRCRNLDEYLVFTEKMEMPLSKRYQQERHFGHCAFLPPEEQAASSPRT